MSPPENCHDKAPIEWFLHSLIAELVVAVGYMSASPAQQEIGRFLINDTTGKGYINSTPGWRR